jgi:exodeoxyribonuclease V beta subunit
MNELDSTRLALQGAHLIEASAGTGKTHNIVRIYLRLLMERELGVEQILVMTFTTAATAELRNRLSRFLRQTAENWQTDDDPIIVALRAHIPAERAQLLLNRALLQLDEAAIFTIHGFCKRALSQQAFFSGMSFNANLEADTSLLTQQATEDWYREQMQLDSYAILYDAWPTPAAFSQHWQQVIDGNAPITLPPVPQFEGLLAAFVSAWPDEQPLFAKHNVDNKRAKAETRALNRATLERFERLARDGDLTDPSGLDAGQLKSCFSTATKIAAMPATHELMQALLRGNDTLKLRLALTGVEAIRAHIHLDKDRLDQLGFNDLIVQLKDALHGPNAVALADALRSQYPAALVDEFQDTDPDQYAILSALYTDQPDTFVCMIGDPKQAIYGFRGGDVFAYLQAREQVDYQWTMNTNYRSDPAVIQGYNRAFLQQEALVNSRTFGFDIEYRAVNSAPKAVDPLWSDGAQRSAVQWVHFASDPNASKGLNKGFQSTIARWCVAEIVHLISQVQIDQAPVQAGDIALLVRSYREAELLQDCLTEAGIHSVYLSSRADVFQSAEAEQLLQLLTGIWQFDNDRSFIAALACQWIGLSTVELEALQQNEHQWAQWQAKFEQWRDDWQHLGLMSMVLAVLQQHFRPSSIRVDRQLTNMLHLAERLQKESGHLRTPDALLHWFERTRQDGQHAEANLLRLESDEALVKIITLHGAKGLEYPIVFLPFVSYFGKSPKAASVVRYHERHSGTAQLSFQPGPDILRLVAEENQAELVRLFYVAATRASKRLYCCMANFTSFAQSALALTLKQSTYDVPALTELLSVAGAASLLTVPDHPIPVPYWHDPSTHTAVQPAQFNGHIERDWWLSSFSALTRHVGHSGHTTPDRDETDPVLPSSSDAQALRFRLTKGAEAGNLLHDCLESADFATPDFTALYAQAADRYSSLTDTFSEAELRTWLTEMLAAPLTQGGSLAELGPDQTLRESEFYFPMLGSRVSRLAELIAEHRGSEYQLPEHLKLKGMMHGFIDLIFERDGQFYVADYKSTFLGEQLIDYGQEAMQASIHSSSYDVQYLIYALALHRYLKVRLPDYQPALHFGGVYYFYLRGMSPGQPGGVFFDPLNAELLNRLDAIFAQTNDLTGQSIDVNDQPTGTPSL